MVTTVQKWGNSQGVRIPKDYLIDLGIKCGDKVVIEVCDQTITLRKIASRKIDLLFADYDGDYVPGEISWDAPVGNEVW